MLVMEVSRRKIPKVKSAGVPEEESAELGRKIPKVLHLELLPLFLNYFLSRDNTFENSLSITPAAL